MARMMEFISKFITFVQMCVLRVLSVGPMPTHIAFIMDGNRRYARKKNLDEGAGHRAGFSALSSMIIHCRELGIKSVTVYAFSIDNFKRRPSEVQGVMDLLEEKALELLHKENILNRYGAKVRFLGNLSLLNESTRVAVENAMTATTMNDKIVLSVCVAYSSTDEIVHAVQLACNEKQRKFQHSSSEITEGYKKEVDAIKFVDIEAHMYLAGIPDPDLVVRTSGETRLSNFLLWQTTHSYLHFSSVLWPGITPWTVLWIILNFQRAKYYLDKKKKMSRSCVFYSQFDMVCDVSLLRM